MQIGYFISGTAGQMAQNKMHTITNNLANANTVGYMENRAAFASMFSSQADRQGVPDQTSSAFLSLNKQYTSTRAGTIRHTGNQLDFAISGKGYFKVQTPDGGVALTRAGNFRLDAEGNLKTQGNLPVLDESGQAIQLPAGEITGTNDGAIKVNDQTVAQLGLSMIKDERLIQKAEGVLLRVDPANMQPADASVTVTHASVEDSNVNSVMAMAEMVDTMRGYQSMMKVIEQYNQIAGQLSDRVGMVQG